MRGLIRRITVAVGAVVVLLGPVVGAAASVNAVPAVSSSAPMPGWSIVQTRNSLARTGQLAGLSCPSSSSCTAVGNFTRGSGVAVTLAEHWDGRRWAIQAAPGPRGARLSVLFSVSCSSPSACTAVGQAVSNQGASAPLAERWNGTRWRIQATPIPRAGGGFLAGVACASASACTAVGNSNSGTLAEHWNGTRWRIQATPNPSGAQFSFLSAVSCASSSACSAVGGYGNSSGTLVTLAERWDGTRWRIQATPNPSGAQFSFLNAVSCTSASACTAAGGYGNSTGEIVSLAERWDGVTWRIQATPNPSGAQVSFLGAVSCRSASACTAIGSSTGSLNTPVTLGERWNGTRWAIQSTPNRVGAAASGLFSVACTSPRSCMAVGGTSSFSDIGGFLAERWNGTRWSILPTPTLPPGMLSTVSCTSPSSCTAVGQTTNRAGIFVPLAERWNGTAWRVQPTPTPGGARGSLFGGVSCPTGSFCMAIGGPGHPKPLAERWNGKTWRILPIPAPAGAQAVFIGPVSCTSPSACTTTGVSFDSSGIGTTLAERWNGRAWRIQPTPNPQGAQGAGLDGGVACTGPSTCTAVGARTDSAGNPVATLAERWNGVKWHIVPSPNPATGGGFRAVSCSAPSACTAVGASNSGTTLAERWNGTRWTIQPTPNPVAASGIALDSVACPARRFCTAVGDYGVNGTGLTLGLQWRDTGQGLQRPTAPSHPGGSCTGLSSPLSRLPWAISDARRALTSPKPRIESPDSRRLDQAAVLLSPFGLIARLGIRLSVPATCPTG